MEDFRQKCSKARRCNELKKFRKNGVGQPLSYPLSYAREVLEVLLVFDRGLRGVINARMRMRRAALTFSSAKIRCEDFKLIQVI
jgi:hypothetical protein